STFSPRLVAWYCPLRSQLGPRLLFISHLLHILKKPLRLFPRNIRAGSGNLAINAGTTTTTHGFREPTYSRPMNTPAGLRVTGTAAVMTGSGFRATGTTQSSRYLMTNATMPAA